MIQKITAMTAAVAADLMKYFRGFDCNRGNIPDGLNQNRLRENDIHLTAVNTPFFEWIHRMSQNVTHLSR